MIWLSVTVSWNFSGISDKSRGDDPDQDRGEENAKKRQDQQNHPGDRKCDMRELPRFIFRPLGKIFRIDGDERDR